MFYIWELLHFSSLINFWLLLISKVIFFLKVNFIFKVSKPECGFVCKAQILRVALPNLSVVLLCKQNRNNQFGDFYIFVNLTYQSYIRYLIHWHFLGPPTSPNFDSHEKLFLIRFGIIPYCNTYFFYFCSLFLIQKFFQLWNFLI